MLVRPFLRRSADALIDERFRRNWALSYKESGSNQDAYKNEEKPLFFEEIIDGFGKRSWVFKAFGE